MDKLRLEYEMKRKGITVAEMCKILGMSVTTYYRKCNGETEFTLNEIKAIVDLLGLETATSIFFAEQVT